MSQSNEFFINTGINSEDVEKGAKSINKAMEEVASNSDEVSLKLKRIGDELVDVTDKTEEEVLALQNTAKEAENTANSIKEIDKATQDVKTTQEKTKEQVESTSESIKEVGNVTREVSNQQPQQQWIEVGNSIINVTGKTQEEIDAIIKARTETQGLANDMEEVAENASKVTENLSSEQNTNTPVNTEGATDLATEEAEAAEKEYVSILERIANKFQETKGRIEDSMDMLADRLNQSGTRNGQMMANTILSLNNVLQNFGSITGRVASTVVKNLGGVAVTGVKKLGSAVKQIAKVGISGAVKGLGLLANAAKKLGSACLNGAKKLLTLHKSNKQMSSGFSGGLKSLLKYGLGISGLMVLLGKLRSAVKDGMKNLAKFDSETNASLSSVTSALATLKNALATAFAPILNVVAPILTQFINKLVDVANTIGAVLAKLTGKGTFSKAIAQQKDYAASLDKTSKSANKQTLSIDELNQSVDENANSGSGGADAGSMFEEVPIDEKSSGIADWLKAMWENADFTELGAKIAEKLANALDNIPWDEIQKTAGKLGKSLATLINGFVEFPDIGYKIGNALAQGINTAIIFFNEFVKNLHWDSVGKFIGDGINGALLNIDWKKHFETLALGFNGLGETLLNTVQTIKWVDIGTNIGQGIDKGVQTIDFKVWADGLSEGFKGAFDGMTASLNEIDWQLLGEKVADFLEEIDWAGIAQSFFTLLGTALASAVEFVWGFIEDAVYSIYDYFKGYIEDYIDQTGEDSLGWAIIYGVLNGIIDAVKGIGQWIKDNIFVPFIEGFKEAFSIHSPSEEMKPLGGYIFEGVLEGFKSKFGDWKQSVNDWYNNDVKPWFTKERWQELGNNVKEGISSKWNELKQNTSEAWGNVQDTISQKWENIKGSASEKVSEVKSNISQKWEDVKSESSTKWATIKDNLTTTWSNVKTNASTKFSDIKNDISKKWADTKSDTNTKWTLIKSNLATAWTNIKNDGTTKFNTLKTNIISAFTGIKNGIKDPINTIIGFVESMVNNLVDGFNRVADAIKDLTTFSWTNPLTGQEHHSNGISLPKADHISLPRLATGTVIPRQAGEFAAILGDNNRETEVVSPLSTIREAVAEETTPYLERLIAIAEEIAAKDLSVSIGDKDVARAARRGESQLGYRIAY